MFPSKAGLWWGVKMTLGFAGLTGFIYGIIWFIIYTTTLSFWIGTTLKLIFVGIVVVLMFAWIYDEHDNW